MDFTIEKYQELLEALKGHKRYIIRHDVDLRPEYALRIAQTEAEAGMQAIYYFREMHFDSHADTIKAIVALGHRAGYHYECLTTCKGNLEAAYEDFCRNLERLRAIVPVSTACAHGSPRSPWNSQELFMGQRVNESTSQQVYRSTGQQVYKSTGLQVNESTRFMDIHSWGIDYEPMLDTDFSKTLYLTDTGRRWDGYTVSVRDKVPQYQEQWAKEGLTFHSTDDIIHALNDIHHPIHQKELLINTHPQRWMPFGPQWLLEATLQNCKNIAKRVIVSLNQK